MFWVKYLLSLEAKVVSTGTMPPVDDQTLPVLPPFQFCTFQVMVAAVGVVHSTVAVIVLWCAWAGPATSTTMPSEIARALTAAMIFLNIAQFLC